MSNQPVVDDLQLTGGDIRGLESADQVAHFFATLHYNVDDRTNIPNIQTLGIDNEDLRQQITRIELIGADPVDTDIKIYLFEVRSDTAKLRNDIARSFRARPENALLVITRDYSELNFVLLNRIVEKSQSKGQSLRQHIRPLPLSVNRLNASEKHLRTLRRFTFTEEDGAYQWEKLRSAYAKAEWIELYFNNRALFSDYYLRQRLTELPQWHEDVRPVGREVYKLTVNARKNYSGAPEVKIRAELFEPIFGQLGFEFTANKDSSATAAQPDYTLYAKGDRSKPIAVALTYVWDRNLDDVDTSRDPQTPDEIPGAVVVSVLEQTDVQWVIVTNGHLWRLYSATASNKATNYYEVDLEAAVIASDPSQIDQIKALKYWWLMFRAQAFTGFLDQLLIDSGKYAKELGDRLKDRVFVEIFPQFAKGFIADLRANRAAEADIDLQQVFSGTMTFLYRLMFILYAESLELLPLNETGGYSEWSLERLKYALRDYGGENETDAPGKLRQHYSPKSTEIYQRLTNLFQVIDLGSDELNMPTYNGGLFSAESDDGRFLASHAIPDQFLALGLDRLTRDEDDKTKTLVMIDYKSLGVRHLGSIYEGLLEFKLRIATEPLAVEKDGKREIYVPLGNAKKKGAQVAVEKGGVYLENDKKERKATGSYYTPDYIVKYIVEHTVGPVLQRKLDECEPRLRDAQKDYRQARALALKKGEDTEKFWQLQEPTSAMSQLVDDCLNIRVLDPAMGSGHFLVEAVDFISNRLIDFLNGWTENPVWAALDRIRDQIVQDMERQRVSIDTDKLTRVALLKRAVLKRCVYGVDLNRMAVELAKVSLWLDAFTLGAPLSFLDHHLKWGNSLIGAHYQEVRDALEGQNQLSLFNQSKFRGLADAVRLMQHVSFLSDSTLSQAKESRETFDSAVEKLSPYKRVLDVYASRWFGNTPIQGKRGAGAFDPTIEFLNRQDTWAWLEDPYDPANRLPADDYMKAGLVAKTALTVAEEKRFFHWEMEFPEVFFAPAKSGEKDVNLRENGGFDAAVGNPPWGASIDSNDQNYFRQDFLSSEATLDSFALFSEQSLDYLGIGGFLGLVIPSGWQTGKSYVAIRRVFIKQSQLHEIINLPYDVFPMAFVDSMIIICEFSGIQPVDERPKYIKVLTFDRREKPSRIDENDRRFSQVNYRKWFIDGIDPEKEFPFLSFLDSAQLDLAIKISESSQNLSDLADIQRGITPFGLVETPSDKTFYHALDGELFRYSYEYSGQRYVKYDPSIAEYKPDRYFRGKRIILRELISRQFRLQSAYVDEDFVSNKSHQTLLPTDPNYSLHFIIAVLNSELLSYYHVGSSAIALRDDFPKIVLAETRRLPIPRISFSTSTDERKSLTNRAVNLAHLNDLHDLLALVRLLVQQNKKDVVHDLLEHLAQQMIDLNKQKQAEVKRFIGWLEGKVKIAPKTDGSTGIDSLTGQTILQNYLGDYQKGQPETSWDDFKFRLHQNRNRFAVSLTAVEGEIQREYERSLAVLLPIKRELARTDTLIDKIVYQLYGLTDAEIELIERPQFEQGLAEAKSQVVKDKPADDETAVEQIAQGILPSAQRFFERVEPVSDRLRLDADLPGWETLPPEVPTFLLTGEYTVNTQPEHLDFSTTVISYAKAVETTIYKRLLIPFREAGYEEAECRNRFLKEFMRGTRDLTLGSFPVIFGNRDEVVLRRFVEQQLPNAAVGFYGAGGVVSLLGDQSMIDTRNAAAHEEKLDRDAARKMRAWAIQILTRV